MTDNYTLVIRSSDRIYSTDVATNFTVNIPADVRDDQLYKVTFSFVIGFLSGSNAYSLQVKSPRLTRAFTSMSTSDDGWRSVVVLNGTEPASPMPIYVQGNPRQMSLRILTASSGAVVNNSTNNEVLTHWEAVPNNIG